MSDLYIIDTGLSYMSAVKKTLKMISVLLKVFKNPFIYKLLLLFYISSLLAKNQYHKVAPVCVQAVAAN